MKQLKYLFFLVFVYFFVFALSCAEDQSDEPVDAGDGGDGDSDSDSDTDSDTDSDSDVDTDSDSDADADSDSDADADTDTDTDTDTNTDTDTDTDTAADSDSDTDTNTDTGTGNGGNYDTSVENSGADCAVSAGSTITATKYLPDPFSMHDGTRISTMAEWKCRRNEIIKDLEEYEIGTKPDPSTVTVSADYSGSTLTVSVTTSSGSMDLTSTVSGASPGESKCVAIGMNGNSSLVGDCIQVPFMHNQVATYNSTSQSDGFYKVYPELWKVGDYAAWSWGISRLIDGIEQVADQIGADVTKIAVHGCSYAGKMALFAGALDERIALTVAQESGGGGITSWRLSQAFTDRTGTNVEKIDNTSTTWFLSNIHNVNPHTLPLDHHELIALIAPRAVVALGNPGYEWLSDESGYKSINAAKEVWKAMGIEDRIGFDFTGGHSHCDAPSSQSDAVDAFVDKFLKGNSSANTNVGVPPDSSYGFDLDWSTAIEWTTPTIDYQQ